MMFGLRPAVLRVGQIAVLVALAVLLWRAADGPAALAHLTGADLHWLVAASLALTVQTLLSAQRWRVTAAQMGLTIPALSALREYYIAQVVNQSLPGGIVGDAARAVRMRAQAGFLVSAQAVLFERVAGQLGLIAVLIAGLALNLALPGNLIWPDWIATAVMAGLATAGVSAALVVTLPAVQQFACRFLQAVWAREVRIQQMTLSFGTALCNVAAFAFCGLAIGVAMPFVAIAALVPLILFAMLLPLSIGGWGLREGAAALVFPLMGATSAEGLATSVCFGLVFLVTILPGVILPLMRPHAPVCHKPD